MYIDIGINLTNKQFAGEYDEVIDRAISAGVEQILLTGTSVRSSKEALALAEEYPETLFSTAGIHPHDAKTMNAESIKILAALLKEKKVVAVGECGLDFDRDFSPRPVQESCFHAQLSLAEEVQKPLFLHERAAFDRFIAILKEHSSLPEGVVHCFTGQLKEAKTYLEMGYYIGFTGAITDMRRFAALEEVVRYVPLDRMLIETDAPFMMPKNVPTRQLSYYQQRRNEPAFLPYVAQIIARYKGVSLKAVADKTRENAEALFKL
ncbi:TatD family hydrolase [Capnocytophaga leadbetteri]|uniref:TatD family hydrolase n=1 Tax=Capnocytophaga leadbetteri TaxID=327575 RepID=UPI0028E8B503|nr:TatD family hydrolase [Capnocytophaga leadbetteri]